MPPGMASLARPAEDLHLFDFAPRVTLKGVATILSGIIPILEGPVFGIRRMIAIPVGVIDGRVVEMAVVTKRLFDEAAADLGLLFRRCGVGIGDVGGWS